MKQLDFYLHYALRNLWRSRRWSTFAIFSVAAGVATVVALRSLGLAIADSLTSNVRSSNHGDITLEISGNGGGFMSMRDPGEIRGFTESEIRPLTHWVDERGGKLTFSTKTGNIQVAAQDFSAVGRPQFITSYFIDPQTYPPTADIRAVEPAGVPLGDLFTGGNEVVISDNLASTQSIRVGDRVRVSGTTEEFVVTGIVPASAEAGLRNLFAAFFGFAYFDESLKEKLPVPADPGIVSILLPDGTSNEDIIKAGQELDRLLPTAAFNYNVRIVPEIVIENQQIADFMSSFIVVLGLGALLIGGVGIMNTMLVLMRRRTDEIATLKTFGLKGRQVALMFMAEAVILGLMGSIVGGFFGTLLSALANAYGQTLIQQALIWRVYPEALLFGLVLGMVITLVFGLIPVLITVKVRPALILRPNESVIPRLGCLQSLLMILLVVLAIGVIAGQILRPAFTVVSDSSSGSFAPSPLLVGIIGVAGTLLILGILVSILWVIVWLIGKLPSLGFIDLRLALRNMTTHRTRTATTLLALSAGMFALSSITFFGSGIRQLIQFTFSEQLGGNVLIFPILPPNLGGNRLVDSTVQGMDGVANLTRYYNYFGELKTIDGVPVPEGEALPFSFPTDERGFGDDDEGFRTFTQYSMSFTARDTTSDAVSTGDLLQGRHLTQEDRGKAVVVMQLRPDLQALGVGVGSTLEFEIEGRTRTFEVVGLTKEASNSGLGINSLTNGAAQIPPGALPTGSQFALTVARVNPDQLNQVLVNLNAVPLLYAFDITFIDSVLSRFLNQMSAIPVLVGILSLGAAAVIMANTVALATLERRRQIGVLKAVGLKDRRVLNVMLLENTVISLLGSLLGIGLSALGIAIMNALGNSVVQLIPIDAMPVAIALLVVAIGIGWLATFLSARPAIAERVTNVLRYE
jgi:ABC-type antimicrobial peptide transport system permease subunit